MDTTWTKLTSSRNSRTCCSNSATVCEEKLKLRRDVDIVRKLQRFFTRFKVAPCLQQHPYFLIEIKEFCKSQV